MGKWIPSGFCLIAVLLICGSAQAADDPTDVLLKNASGQYANLEFEGALNFLNKALANQGNTRRQLIRVHHLRGLCLGALGRYADAKKSFAHLLALDPSFRLGADVSPRVQAPFAELLRESPPKLEVRLLPPPTAVKDKALVMTAQVQSDSIGMARALLVWFRRGDAGSYSTIRAKLQGEGEYRVSIPASMWQGDQTSGAVAWYALVVDENRAELQRFGDDMHPQVLEVTERATQAAGPAVAEADPWYGKWWVWTLVGGVVIAGATTAVVLTQTGEDKGPFDFTVDFQ